MKVLVISAAYPPFRAGEATNALFLCRHLAERKMDVHVRTSHGNIGTGESGITVHSIMRHWSWLEIPRFRAFLNVARPMRFILCIWE